MVQAQEKLVFEGLAKIRLRPGPHGGFRISAEVNGPGADMLKTVLGHIVMKLASADDASLETMAKGMRQT